MCRHVEHCECELDVAVNAHGAGQEQVLHELVRWAELMEARGDFDGKAMIDLMKSGKWLDEVLGG